MNTNKEKLNEMLKGAIQEAIASVSFETKEKFFSGEVKFIVKNGWAKVSDLKIN